MEMVQETKKPRSEVSIKRMILTRVRKDLAEAAAKRAKETGGSYIEPTDEEITAECKKRWQNRLDRLKPKEDVSKYFD